MPSSFVTAAGLHETNTFTAAQVLAPTANASGVRVLLTLTGAADTGVTASTEQADALFNGARTLTFATGALTNQRSFQFAAPTLAFAGASTVTNAATVYIDRAPQAGTNATITNGYALWVDAGTTRLDGAVVLGSTLTLSGALIGPMSLTKADGTTKLIESNATGLGFYGATPVARPTGVAVDAAGIHAALVSLGLITA